MTAKYKKCLFVFRRDLRLEDNIGLIHALEHSGTVIACFIFTPTQIEQNPYRSDACLQFMIESLEDLAQQLKDKNGKLYLFYGQPEEIVEQCIKKLSVDHVVANRDYTPYSQERDKKITEICKNHNIEFLLFDDALLHPPENTLKSDGKPYSIFTPYFRNASKLGVASIQQNHRSNYFHHNIEFAKNEAIYTQILPNRSSHLCLKGGRTAGLKILNEIASFSKYAKDRDYPSQAGTTHLSAYLKFTVFSPREVYYKISACLGNQHELIRALHWRDFFSGIAFFFPYVFKGAFHQKFDKLKWNSNQNIFKQWCEGKTGFPIVDAGMREMNETGFMHNRVRMIVASFLTKDLHIDWRWGEKYFAQKLIDYDPAVNNGNWQWSASTGCDAQPYFRIFNPWNQQEKFDADCTYIKQWVPELKTLAPKSIHRWHDSKMRMNDLNYPAPIVDHAIEAQVALAAYRAL